MTKAHVKKNDTVIVLTGKDKGKQGQIIAISLKKGKVIVKDVAIMTKHVKARKAGEQGGIKKQESWIDISNVKRI